MLSLSSAALAGPGFWTTGGPYGGAVYVVAIDPTNPATLWTGTGLGIFKSEDDVVHGVPQGGGVFKSTDAGAKWFPASEGLNDLCVDSLVIPPTDPTTLYARTRDGELFRSNDSGGTWAIFDTGLTGLGSLVIHPTDPATLYAGADGGVFRSTDAGATWTAVNRGLPSPGAEVLAVDPTGPTTVYVRKGAVWQATPPTAVDSPTSFYPLSPCRVLDTRDATGTFGGPALMAADDRVFPLFGRCGIPGTAWAVSVNLTVTQPTAPGNLRLYPGGTAVPLVSSINYVAGETRANDAIVALGGLGEVAVFCAQASGTVHVILDVNGYFE